MPAIINGNDGIDKVKDGTLVVADVKTGDPVGFNRMQLFASQATTSGTSIDFTSIPSWAKRVTLVFGGVSTNGTSDKRIQLGSGSIQTSGYVTSKSYSTSAPGNGSSTAGFEFMTGGLAAEIVSGTLTFTNLSGNTWIGVGALGSTSGNQPGTFNCGGSVTLSGSLDRIRLTTVNGTDLFDAGSVSILVEGYV